MKKIFLTFVLFFVSVFCFAQNFFEPEQVLSEDLAKNFTTHYKDFFAELKDQSIGTTISAMITHNVRETFDAVRKLKPSKKAGRVFEKYSFDKDKGLYQFLVLQYGIVAYTIEEALLEIQGTTRSEKQKENDRQTVALLSEIKAQINSKDYELIKKYGKDLYAIFNAM